MGARRLVALLALRQAMRELVRAMAERRLGGDGGRPSRLLSAADRRRRTGARPADVTSSVTDR